MRKIAQNCKKFHRKKVTFLFLIWFGWNSKSILTLLKASFLLIFKAVAPKNQKLRFFMRFQYFCDALYYDFWFAKNIVILIEIWAIFYRKWKTICHKTHNLVEKNPWKAFRVRFLDVFVKKGPKNANFQKFLPGVRIFQFELEPWAKVKTTQIIPLFIGLCLYFEGISIKDC